MTPNTNEFVNFDINVPMTVVLDTEPSQARSKDKISKAGKPYKMWIYFCKENKIFMAMRDLHQALQTYHKGDTVTITQVAAPGQKYGRMQVEAAGGSNTQVKNDSYLIGQITLKTTQTIAKNLEVLNQKIDSLISVLQPNQKIEEKTNKETITETAGTARTSPSLDFTGTQAEDADLGF